MRFDPSSIARDYDSERPRLVGVYFLMRGSELFYLGQSTNIDHRITAHRADPRMREIDRVLWIDLAESDLDAYEGALLRALRPVGNTKRAPGNPDNDTAVLAQFGLEPANRRNNRPAAVPRVRRFVELGARIRTARVAVGLRQDDVARALGIHKTSVSHWEKGASAPSNSRLSDVAAVLGVPVSALVHDSTVGVSRNDVCDSAHADQNCTESQLETGTC